MSRESFLLRHNIFFKNCSSYSLNYILEKLKLHTIYPRRYYFEELIRNIYNDFIACPSVLEAVSIRVPVRNIRDHDNCYTSFSCNNVLLSTAP
jgi:hypothetical protein